MSHQYERCSLENWRKLWRKLGSTANVAPAWTTLVTTYARPERKYHNLHHIVYCLEKFDATHKLFLRPDIAELVLWYHDSVYDPKAPDNEEQSLLWLQKDVTTLAPKLKLNLAGELLLATKHKAKAKGDVALVQDIDLSILGAAPAQFEAYDHAIRQEYQWVDTQTYQTERAKVLRKLGTPPIFTTTHFRERLEAQAVINIAQAIQNLRRSYNKL